MFQTATQQTQRSDDERWTAVVLRENLHDDDFVYAVHSTRIFCRPTCSARKPRREQVTFYHVPAEAVNDGYRACKRCRPDGTVIDPAVAIVQSACALIDENPTEPHTLASLAHSVGMSPAHFQRVFKRVTGVTPRQYVEVRRLEHFKDSVKTSGSVTEALYEAGYGSGSRLYERADSRLGMTPKAYRDGAPGRTIRYTVSSSSLGLLLVAATERGICFVSLGDSETVLRAELRREFPLAELTRDDVELSEHVRQLTDHLEGREPNINLPLDVRATAFQQLVWRELQHIPYGSTRTYREVACAIGKPQAARAVARACATNPVSIAIPCHRVVREDGALTGYRWGIERKKKLLAHERTGETPPAPSVHPPPKG